MHDLSQQKTSESYGKIKESIVLKIQKTFTSSRLIVQSISTNKAQVFSVPELKASLKVDAAEKALENRMLEMKWKVDYEIYLREEDNFKDNWVKAYALIWDSYCSREMQVAVREMPDFDTQIINESL